MPLSQKKRERKKAPHAMTKSINWIDTIDKPDALPSVPLLIKNVIGIFGAKYKDEDRKIKPIGTEKWLLTGWRKRNEKFCRKRMIWQISIVLKACAKIDLWKIQCELMIEYEPLKLETIAVSRSAKDFLFNVYSRMFERKNFINHFNDWNGNVHTSECDVRVAMTSSLSM